MSRFFMGSVNMNIADHKIFFSARPYTQNMRCISLCSISLSRAQTARPLVVRRSIAYLARASIQLMLAIGGRVKEEVESLAARYCN